MKRHLLIFVWLIASAAIWGQVPYKMSYQAIIRNSQNALVQSQAVSVRISVLQGGPEGRTVYSEVHQASTNVNGMVSLMIGGGTVLSGSFERIPWGEGPFFLKTETDPSGGDMFSISGITELLSVPYAFQAAKAGSFSDGKEAGNILYWDGAQWTFLPPGLPGQSLFLSENGLPVWAGPTFASVITLSVTDLSYNAAVLNGMLLSNGGGSVQKGFVWSGFSNPTIEDASGVASGAQDSFRLAVSGLKPGTKYFVRAFAENRAGIVYGNEVSFTTYTISPPVLSTIAPSNITRTTASSGGNITDNGGLEITERGVCWSTAPLPAITDHKVVSPGTNLGSYIAELTGLPPATRVYIRAYAINLSGTGYGNEIEFSTGSASVPSVFTLSMSDISTKSAKGHGRIGDDGGSPVLNKGFCWGTDSGPTIDSAKVEVGPGTEDLEGLISGLTPATSYYLRSFATNANGTAYGNEITFSTKTINIPSVSTLSISKVGADSAVASGRIFSDGGDSITGRGFCWGTGPNPTIAGNKLELGKGVGSFSGTIKGLSPGTAYYLRSYASNSAGTAYGNEIAFSTMSLTAPEVGALTMSSVGSSRAWGKSAITNGGGTQVTSRGICYSQSPNPTIDGSKILLGSGTGNFGGAIKGLIPGKKYYLRSFAVNAQGVSYSAEISITTPALLSDIDGNVYNIVMIGNQTWMAENLRTTRYNNGDNILHLPNNGDWKSSTSGAWSYYQNNETYNIPYGKMYNWTAVSDSRNVCPEGWHVSTSPDWHTMFLSLGAKEPFINYREILAPKIRIEGTEYWGVINKDATNESGLSGLPGGWRNIDGSFDFLLNRTWFWTATEYNITSSYGIDLQPEHLIGEGPMSKMFGLYVRCVKN